MEDEVNARLQRLQIVGGAQRGIDQREHASAAADFGKLYGIHDAQVWVGRRFTDDKLCARSDRCFHRLVVARGHLFKPHPKSSHVLAAKLPAAVVALVKEDDLLAGVEVGHQEADERRHAG